MLMRFVVTNMWHWRILKMVEHYADLQEKYNELVEKHRLILEGIAEVKRAAAKAGVKGHGKRFSKSLAAELSVLRVEREREKERELLKENRSLKSHLRDTAEAVHAAGEVLVRLREAGEAAAAAQQRRSNYVQDSNPENSNEVAAIKKVKDLGNVCMEQAAEIEKLNNLYAPTNITYVIMQITVVEVTLLDYIYALLNGGRGHTSRTVTNSAAESFCHQLVQMCREFAMTQRCSCRRFVAAATTNGGGWCPDAFLVTSV